MEVGRDRRGAGLAAAHKDQSFRQCRCRGAEAQREGLAAADHRRGVAIHDEAAVVDLEDVRRGSAIDVGVRAQGEDIVCPGADGRSTSDVTHRRSQGACGDAGGTGRSVELEAARGAPDIGGKVRVGVAEALDQDARDSELAAAGSRNSGGQSELLGVARCEGKSSRSGEGGLVERNRVGGVVDGRDRGTTKDAIATDGHAGAESRHAGDRHRRVAIRGTASQGDDRTVGVVGLGSGSDVRVGGNGKSSSTCDCGDFRAVGDALAEDGHAWRKAGGAGHGHNVVGAVGGTTGECHHVAKRAGVVRGDHHCAVTDAGKGIGLKRAGARAEAAGEGRAYLGGHAGAAAESELRRTVDRSHRDPCWIS